MKRNKGFTLLEAVTALALWCILAASLTVVWVNTTRGSLRVIAAQDAYENARVSLDALLINMQLADTILLETDNNHVLKRLTLTQLDPEGNPHDYIFYFDKNAQLGEAKYHRLEFGLHNEFASQIASVTLTLVNENHMQVTVITDGEATPSVTLTGSVDIRYKDVKPTP